jgi:hypothetical protein
MKDRFGRFRYWLAVKILGIDMPKMSGGEIVIRPACRVVDWDKFYPLHIRPHIDEYMAQTLDGSTGMRIAHLDGLYVRLGRGGDGLNEYDLMGMESRLGEFLGQRVVMARSLH